MSDVLTSSRTQAKLAERVAQAMEKLNAALAGGPETVEADLDAAEVLCVRFRDEVILRVRETGAERAEQLHGLLKQANVVLSLIASVEYPLKGLRRSAIEQAVGVLAEARSKLAAADAQR